MIYADLFGRDLRYAAEIRSFAGSDPVISVYVKSVSYPLTSVFLAHFGAWSPLCAYDGVMHSCQFTRHYGMEAIETLLFAMYDLGYSRLASPPA